MVLLPLISGNLRTQGTPGGAGWGRKSKPGRKVSTNGRFSPLRRAQSQCQGRLPGLTHRAGPEPPSEVPGGQPSSSLSSAGPRARAEVLTAQAGCGGHLTSCRGEALPVDQGPSPMSQGTPTPSGGWTGGLTDCHLFRTIWASPALGQS